ncbi:phage tail protein [Pseudoalteromonas luteoviolacea]|uniref:phage tail-collar fiber domain-containing protein n=1 Tax=Pseudoalteromonas luteoviolacea TaxID=43657 RepID=UPI0011541C0F|nr:phage tail protein [Pseudoalteromonas luteoviolacea]TQF71804.1 hypothetical protein FLM44_12280 [Pseudoalteromonas luteoviolacea]
MATSIPTYEIYHFNITSVGEELLLNTQTGGPSVQLDKIALGTEMYDPAIIPDQRMLKAEVDRASILDFKRVDKTLQMASIFDDPSKSYSIGEMGLITDKGELFAVYSNPNKLIGHKTHSGRYLPKFALAIDQIPKNSVTVVFSGENLNIIITPELAKMALSQIRLSRIHISMLSREINNKLNGAD